MNTIEITLNGRTTTATAVTIADLVREHAGAAGAAGVAVAVNDTVVPRQEWPTRRIETGDTVEIVHAVQGG